MRRAASPCARRSRNSAARQPIAGQAFEDAQPVAARQGQRGAQAFGEGRAVVGHRRIARRLAVDSPRSACRQREPVRSSSSTGHMPKNSAPTPRCRTSGRTSASPRRARWSGLGRFAPWRSSQRSRPALVAARRTPSSSAAVNKGRKSACGSSRSCLRNARVSSRNFGRHRCPARSISPRRAAPGQSSSPSIDSASRATAGEVWLNSREPRRARQRLVCASRRAKDHAARSGGIARRSAPPPRKSRHEDEQSPGRGRELRRGRTRYGAGRAEKFRTGQHHRRCRCTHHHANCGRFARSRFFAGGKIDTLSAKSRSENQ